jgi:hypothetical protein
MTHQHQSESSATSRRAPSTSRQTILVAGCVAGVLLTGTVAEARTAGATRPNGAVAHSSVLRGQLAGHQYGDASKILQPMDGTTTGHHSDYSYHGDTPHNDSGALWWHTDVGHSDYNNHVDHTDAATTTTSPSP